MSAVHQSGVAASAPLRRAVRELPPSEPVVFDSFTGIYQAAPGGDGHPVLMLSPFGYEELCGRAFWTALAEHLAEAGMPSLRFDFPGTGNALDAATDGLADWRAAALAAADELRIRTGRPRLAVLGQGLGATLALSWAADLGPLSAAVLLEPATSGRAYLRGLKAWGAAVATASGLPAGAEGASGYAVAGFAVPDDRVAAIQALDLKAVEPPQAAAILVLEQPGGSAGRSLAKRFGPAGIETVCRDFSDYAALVTDPTSAVTPLSAMTTVVEWLATRGPAQTAREAAPRPASARAAGEPLLQGDAFVERPVRFGQAQRLAGVLCLPRDGGAYRQAVVIVSAGRDHSIGWGRSAVAQARAFAAAGVASLRFDIGGVGDSRAADDQPGEILYSDAMCGDVRTAVDYMHGLNYLGIGLVGRCSGAWAAFTVAAEDPRIESLALVNTGYFLWDGTKSLAEVIRFAQRSVGDLGATLLRRNGLRRLLKGQLDLRGAVRFLMRQANCRLLRPLAPLLGRLTAESRRYHDLHALFRRLKSRDVRVLLAYSDGDTSLDELRSFMGKDLKRLGRYPGVTVSTVAGADHNFTPLAARTELLAHLVTFFRSARPQAADGLEPAAAEADSRPARNNAYVLVSGQA